MVQGSGVLCPICNESGFCANCGASLAEAQAQPPEAARRRTVGGRVLAYDWRAGSGVISGSDGSRYTFASEDWIHQTMPRTGSTVDFVPEGDSAKEIYLTGGSFAFSGSESKRLVAGLMGVLIGWLGIHKFYLGYNGAGIVLLLMGTIGWFAVLPGIAASVIGIVEGIIYLTKTDDEFEEMYVTGNRPWF